MVCGSAKLTLLSSIARYENCYKPSYSALGELVQFLLTGLDRFGLEGNCKPLLLEADHFL